MQEKENQNFDYRTDYKLNLRKKNLTEILKTKRNNSKNILCKKDIDSILFNINSLPEIRLYDQSYNVCKSIDDKISYCFRGLEDNSIEFKYFCVSKLCEIKSYINKINLLSLINSDIIQLIRLCFDKNVMFEATSIIEELMCYSTVEVINAIVNLKISNQLFELLKFAENSIIKDNILSIFGFIFERNDNACYELICRIGIDNIYFYIQQALNNYFYFPLFSRGNLIYFITKFIQTFDNTEKLYFNNDFAVQLLSINLNIFNYEFNEEFTFEIMKSAQFILNIIDYIDTDQNDKNIFNQLKEEIVNFYNDFLIACVKIIKNDKNKRITNLALLIIEKITYYQPSLWENIIKFENFHDIIKNTITKYYQVSNVKLTKHSQRIITNTYCICLNMLIDLNSHTILKKHSELLIFLINVIMRDNHMSTPQLTIIIKILLTIFVSSGYKALKSILLYETNLIAHIINCLRSHQSSNKEYFITILYHILNDETTCIAKLEIKESLKLNGLSDIIDYLISQDEIPKKTLPICQKICDILSGDN